MTKREFKKLFNNRIVLLDGGMGTLLQKMGMPAGVCPEKWACENTDLIQSLQKKYVEAGANIIYSFTFGANPIKLSEYGLAEETYSINKTLAMAARKAAGEKGLVAGDISSCGSLLAPYGNIEFEEAVNSFKEQIKGLLDGGVDLFVIETMMDLQEARAAIIAIKELCDLPVIATMTYEPNMRTLMGSDPVSALVTLQSLGADAVGCNCSSGPVEMVEIISKMKPYAKVPLVAKPNAGKPRFKKGKTVFDMDAESFASYAEALVEAGANALGGCCGTTPEYIEKLAEATKNLYPVEVERKPYSLACSNRQTVEIHPSLPFAVIGERLNPTGKKALKEALLKGDMDYVSDIAREQVEAGAKLLDINAGVPGIDEKDVLVSMIDAVCNAVSAPILIDTSNAEALEKALRIYPGRAIINSISGERDKLEKFLPLAKKYGAMFVLLPVNDTGVPETAEERIAIIKDVYRKARKMGFTKEDILVDGLVMTVASNPEAALEALKVINWCHKRFKTNTTMGLSNVSFGLPAREHVNSAFLAMAVANGLSTAIMNPNSKQMMDLVRASDVLSARDRSAINYTEFYSGEVVSKENASNAKEGLKSLYDAIISGDRNNIEELVRQELISGRLAKDLIDGELIPAIQKVGELYEKGKYFLPQLIRGAEAMEKAMAILTPELIKDGGESTESKGTVVIATVKGDVHDIGKNIVAMLLKNYGFNVIDLGKDVEGSRIIEAAKEHKADIIALSALMTTTMGEMPKVMELVRKEGLNCSMMVGGAVLDKNYAESFGAHYSNDAYSAVKLAEKLMNDNLH
ncbi:MAG: dihydropteroate synthase [Clostridiaceae bacterium]|nr:dihydropteroate synthase [Clostridiaceae bacterium]